MTLTCKNGQLKGLQEVFVRAARSTNWGSSLEPFVATQDHTRLRETVREALGPWRRFVVALDGVDAAGKSTLARYLAWQLGMPAIETDLYFDAAAGGLTYRLDDLKHVIHDRLSRNRPIIVEGVRILQLLRALDVTHDFLIWVEQEDHGGSLRFQTELRTYLETFRPRDHANAAFKWCLDSFPDGGR